MDDLQKRCIKCGSTNANQKEVSTSWKGFSKLFDVQNNTLKPTTLIVKVVGFILVGYFNK